MIEFEGVEYDPDAWIGTGLAAQIAGKHRRTVLGWCKRDAIKSRKMPGVRGQYEIRVGDLIAALTKPGYQPPEAHGNVDVEDAASVPAQ